MENEPLTSQFSAEGVKIVGDGWISGPVQRSSLACDKGLLMGGGILVINSHRVGLSSSSSALTPACALRGVCSVLLCHSSFLPHHVFPVFLSSISHITDFPRIHHNSVSLTHSWIQLKFKGFNTDGDMYTCCVRP